MHLGIILRIPGKLIQDQIKQMKTQNWTLV